jgi:hypothetical protein
VERSREEPGLVVTRILTVEQAQRERTTGLALELRVDTHGPGHIDRIVEVLQRARGSCPVFLFFRDPSGKIAVLKASDSFRVNPATLPRAELEAVLGPGTVRFSRQGSNGTRNGH